ncbi:8564_t:CDS:2 [Paraglomus brasilianum]|uniref:8564_t:CDS:1 n=1 Tax=Paraglomus brasilianum TaxID=144538 RepID=A0A9N9FS68_9GLOM|nr:8564_t:CDS:2 [Paraglomus brasilianum]
MASQAVSEKGRRLAKQKYPSYNRNNLPTLKEVLQRKTAPPVCLFNFYIYMRDREHDAEYLDFWLDVAELELLCRYYLKDLKKFGIDSSVEFPEYAKSKDSDKEKRHSTQSSLHRHLSASSSSTGFTDTDSRSGSPMPLPLTTGTGTETPQHEVIDVSDQQATQKLRYRDSVRSSTTGNLSFIGQRPITRDDVTQLAQRIYFLYLVPNAEREISLSPGVLNEIRIAVEEKHKDDPAIYKEAKKEVYRLMKREIYPNFLKARAYGNMTPRQTLIRLGLGLFSLFVGFTVELSLILLDEKPRSKRLWGFIPIFIGILNLFAFQMELSPLLVLLHISERSFMQYELVREKYIYRRIHVPKALWILFMSLAASIIVTGLLLAIPGHRL